MKEKSKIGNKGLYGIVIMLLVLVILAVFLFIQVLSIKKDLQPQIDAVEAAQESLEEPESEELKIYLPETLYAATGLIMEIYNSQITNKCSYITEYNVLWSCDIGENLERKYSLTATEEMIGEHELTVSIYDNALNLLAEKSCTLNVVEGTLQEGFSLLEIGDSLSCDGMLYR